MSQRAVNEPDDVDVTLMLFRVLSPADRRTLLAFAEKLSRAALPWNERASFALDQGFLVRVPGRLPRP